MCVLNYTYSLTYLTKHLSDSLLFCLSLSLFLCACDLLFFYENKHYKNTHVRKQSATVIRNKIPFLPISKQLDVLNSVVFVISKLRNLQK